METATRKLQFEPGSKKLETMHVLDQPEQMFSDQKKFDKEETPIENRESMSPEDHVFESKELIRMSGGIGGRSRILRLASIARYRRKRRLLTAEKAGRN